MCWASAKWPKPPASSGSTSRQALGVADKVTRLYALVRDYALSAYNALVALLGPAVAQTAAQQVLAWVNDVAAGEQFRKLLTQLYGTKQTAEHLDTVVTGSQADLNKFVIAIQDVDGLNTGFQQQLDLVDKLLRGFRLVGGAGSGSDTAGSCAAGCRLHRDHGICRAGRRRLCRCRARQAAESGARRASGGGAGDWLTNDE